MLQGQCLCGVVQYVYHAELKDSILCFCQHCRLAQGSMVAWNTPIERQFFELTTGHDQLKGYMHTAGKYRVFCQNCGTALYSYRDDLEGVIRLRLGTVVKGDIPAPDRMYFSEQKPSFISVSACQKADL